MTMALHNLLFAGLALLNVGMWFRIFQLGIKIDNLEWFIEGLVIDELEDL
jgi:hypothetical protein